MDPVFKFLWIRIRFSNFLDPDLDPISEDSGKLKIKKQFKVGDLGLCLAIQAVVTREQTTRRCNIGDATEYFKQGLFPYFRMQKKMLYWSNHWISALQPTIRMPKKTVYFSYCYIFLKRIQSLTIHNMSSKYS